MRWRRAGISCRHPCLLGARGRWRRPLGPWQTVWVRGVWCNWCMLWRLRKRDYDAMKGAANRDAIRAAVVAGPPPGLLAYDGVTPIGWISIAPREVFRRLDDGERSLLPR